MNNYNFLIGADPEYGICNFDGYSYPPILLINNEKVPVNPNYEKPDHHIFSRLTTPKTVLHMDGTALELEITPSATPKKLWNHLQIGINLIDKLLSPFDYLIRSPLPTLPWNINEYTLEKMGDEFIHLTRFGCDPDFDAYESSKEQDEENAELHPYRYFGGHIHLGVPEELKDKTKRLPDVLAIICSVYWGNLCTSRTLYDESEKLRLYRYGKPGRFRPQPHGIEYRSPSNSWTSEYSTIEEIYKSANFILNAFDNELIGREILSLSEATFSAITSFNKEECKRLYNEALSIV